MTTLEPTPEKDPQRYRANVGLAVFHKSGLVFFGKRMGVNGPHVWQMPQGGVDRGEDPRDAAFRELEEEIGVPPRLAKGHPHRVLSIAVDGVSPPRSGMETV